MTMDCRDIAELLPDYLQGQPSPDVDAHLRDCDACREEVELWTRLGSIPLPRPRSAAMRARFDTMMESVVVRPPRGWVFAQIAAAAALIVLAFFAGKSFERNAANTREIAALHRELADTRQLVAVSLLQHESASDRLEGVSWSTRVAQPKPEVLEALLYTLRYDSSVDVRLAALDALRHYSDQPLVRRGVPDSLDQQKSPLVQIAVVDFLVQSRDRGVIGKLRAFEQAPGIVPAVRERVEHGIDQLNRG
jgi:hypothetical protein